MWIETQSGTMINLSKVEQIFVRPRDEKHQIAAMFADGSVVIATFDSIAETGAAFGRLKDQMYQALGIIPPWKFCKAEGK